MLARVKKATCPAARSIDVKDVLNWSHAWIESVGPFSELPCAFFDIDFTLVDGRGKPLEEVIKLVRKCEQYGVHCFYVTARPESGRAETLRLLQRLKLDVKTQDLAMYPPELPTTFESIARMKRKYRARMAHGHTPVLNVGDTFSDGGSTTQLEMLGGVSIDDPKVCGVFFMQNYPFCKLPGRGQ